MQNKKSLIVFFDGVCPLCNGFVDFLISRDQRSQFHFAPLQGETARTLLKQEQRQNLNSVIALLILDSGQKIYLEQSDAIFACLQLLPAPWKFLFVFSYIPRFIRNLLYHLIARSRYQIFGKRDSCRIATQAEKNWLLP